MTLLLCDDSLLISELHSPHSITGCQSVYPSMSCSSMVEEDSCSLDRSFESDDSVSVTPPRSPGSGDSRCSLKFSVAEIMRPEFGQMSVLQRNVAAILAVMSASSKAAPNSLHIQTSVPPMAVQLASPPLSSPDTPSPAVDGDKAAKKVQAPQLFPAWIYCTRYSDRPSSGPRCRRVKQKPKKLPEPTNNAVALTVNADEKRPRTAFTPEQLSRLKHEFQENRYLTEKRRQNLARELGLKESQIKIWFQNKRAKIKKLSPMRNPLALHLMAQGLYNHSTIPVSIDMDSDESEMA